MKKVIYINGRAFGYEIRKSRRARRLRLAVGRDLGVALTLPAGIKESAGERFLKEKADWLFRKIEFFKTMTAARPLKLRQREYLKKKRAARRLAEDRLEFFNRNYGFKINKIAIRNQKTRWGSCSKKGNLNFNYRIADLPARLADYIIAHELCHLGEFSHSKKFWALLARTVPDYRLIKKELRRQRL